VRHPQVLLYLNDLIFYEGIPRDYSAVPLTADQAEDINVALHNASLLLVLVFSTPYVAYIAFSCTHVSTLFVQFVVLP